MILVMLFGENLSKMVQPADLLVKGERVQPQVIAVWNNNCCFQRIRALSARVAVPGRKTIEQPCSSTDIWSSLPNRRSESGG